MLSNTIIETFVTLETIGVVRLSTVHLKGDGYIRPWQYYETAAIWDSEEHGIIIDSNVATRDQIQSVHETYSDAPTLAKLLATTPRYQWDW